MAQTWLDILYDPEYLVEAVASGFQLLRIDCGIAEIITLNEMVFCVRVKYLGSCRGGSFNVGSTTLAGAP